MPSPNEALHGRSTAIEVAAMHAVNGNPMYPPFEGMNYAMFGLGCFWWFGCVLGVLGLGFWVCRCGKLLLSPSPKGGGVFFLYKTNNDNDFFFAKSTQLVELRRFCTLLSPSGVKFGGGAPPFVFCIFWVCIFGFLVVCF